MNRISIHFTTKGQSVNEIYDKLMKFINKNQSLKNKSSFKYNPNETYIHHCFLPLETVIEKNFSTEIYDNILNNKQICRGYACWYKNQDDLDENRLDMLTNLKRLGGVAIFIGEIKDGVKVEFDMVKELGIPFYAI